MWSSGLVVLYGLVNKCTILVLGLTGKCCRGLIEHSSPKIRARKLLGVEAIRALAAGLESGGLPQTAGRSLYSHHPTPREVWVPITICRIYW